MRNDISTSDNTIDSRDVIARVEELTGERDSYNDEHEADDTSWAKAFPMEAEELEELEKLAAEAEKSPDWLHGETLINEDYFTDYIEELIKDCYEMPKAMESGEWPWRHMTMDYEAAAKEAKVDYMEVSFRGVTFLIRA